MDRYYVRWAQAESLEELARAVDEIVREELSRGSEYRLVGVDHARSAYVDSLMMQAVERLSAAIIFHREE